MANKLTNEQKLLLHMLSHGNDVSIDELFDALDTRVVAKTSRTKQQVLGSKFAKINRIIAEQHQRIVPGNARKTYCLRTTKPEPSYV